MMQELLNSLISGVQGGGLQVIDLTQLLNEDTPILELPPQWGQTIKYKSHEISKYDDQIGRAHV